MSGWRYKLRDRSKGQSKVFGPAALSHTHTHADKGKWRPLTQLMWQWTVTKASMRKCRPTCEVQPTGCRAASPPPPNRLFQQSSRTVYSFYNGCGLNCHFLCLHTQRKFPVLKGMSFLLKGSPNRRGVRVCLWLLTGRSH